MEAIGGLFMGTRKPTEAATRRAPDGVPTAIREAGVRAALKLDEAGLQSLVRTLSTQMPGGRGR